MAKVNVSLPDDLLRDVDALAGELKRSRSGFVQEATARYVAEVRAEKERRERSERIGNAMDDMRAIAQRIPPGEDLGVIVRGERDAPPRSARDAPPRSARERDGD